MIKQPEYQVYGKYIRAVISAARRAYAAEEVRTDEVHAIDEAYSYREVCEDK